MRRLASLQHQQPNKQQLDLAESTPFHHQVQHSSKSINDNPDEPKHKLFPHNRIITNYEQNVLSGYDEGGGDDCGPDHNNNNNPAISGGTGAVKKGENFARNLLLDKENIMGSNVSRHSGKGLSGRRSLSSGKCFPFTFGLYSQEGAQGLLSLFSTSQLSMNPSARPPNSYSYRITIKLPFPLSFPQ